MDKSELKTVAAEEATRMTNALIALMRSATPEAIAGIWETLFDAIYKRLTE